MFQKQRTYDNQTSFHFLKFQYFPSHYKEALILCFKLCWLQKIYISVLIVPAYHMSL